MPKVNKIATYFLSFLFVQNFYIFFLIDSFDSWFSPATTAGEMPRILFL